MILTSWIGCRLSHIAILSPIGEKSGSNIVSHRKVKPTTSNGF